MNEARCELLLSVFPTSLGWFGLLGDGEAIHGVEIGHDSAASLRRRVGKRSSRESDWDPELRSRMEDFAAGEPTDFDDVALVLPPMTEFQFLVMNHVRGVNYGQTISYGEVARRIGRPRAARGVGRDHICERGNLIVTRSTSRFKSVCVCVRAGCIYSDFEIR